MEPILFVNFTIIGYDEAILDLVRSGFRLFYLKKQISIREQGPNSRKSFKSESGLWPR